MNDSNNHVNGYGKSCCQGCGNNCPPPCSRDKCCRSCNGHDDKRSCRCSCKDVCVGGGLVNVNIIGFNTNGFTYVISQGGQQVERAVSLSAFGIDFNPFGPRMISGTVRSDGTVVTGGENFSVSHEACTGIYTVTFKRAFTIVDAENQPPEVTVIPEPINVGVGAPVGNVSDIITGLVDAQGRILDGTTLGTSDEYAFTIVKNPSVNGYYRMRFRPELNVELLLEGGVQIEVFEDLIPPQESCCCSCTCCESGANGDILGYGVDLINVDKTGFIYRPYEETILGKNYRDLPVNFSVLFIRKES